jgi:hypothetical protein
MITSATIHLLRASTMSSLQLRYYVLGDDPDFCFPVSALSEASIMVLAKTIQKDYLEYTGIKLLFPKLFRIDKPQDEIVDIASPTTDCMGFGKRIDDHYDINSMDEELVHILVIAKREWHLIFMSIHTTAAVTRTRLEMHNVFCFLTKLDIIYLARACDRGAYGREGQGGYH